MAYEDRDYNEPEYFESGVPYDETSLYEDTFGERIQTGDDQALADEDMAEDEIGPVSGAEDGFGETLDQNPHLEDQIADEDLSKEAEADYADDQTIS